MVSVTAQEQSPDRGKIWAQFRLLVADMKAQEEINLRTQQAQRNAFSNELIETQKRGQHAQEVYAALAQGYIFQYGALDVPTVSSGEPVEIVREALRRVTDQVMKPMPCS